MNKTNKTQDVQVNEAIRAREVRLIDVDGRQIGIVPLKEALRQAREKNLDLVNIAPQANPPVCRIMDYGKYKFEQSKKEKEARKKQKVITIKEVRFSATIEEHDFNTKLRHVIQFLRKGDKVKCSLRFRGRQITHADLGTEIMQRIIDGTKDIAVVEKTPGMEGRSMIMVLAPKAEAKA
ncbi:MAG: translation initiation factor IF-3 [Hydrogenibacillus sp.]|nr:translation initiation factor IF-3 [Hydrogenibacillus sp.]